MFKVAWLFYHSFCPVTTGYSINRRNQACQPRLAPQGDFLPPESHQRPPKAGPSPAFGILPAGTGLHLRLPLLGPVLGSCHIDSMDIVWTVPTPLVVGTSFDRALSWCAAVPSYREPGSRRRERRLSVSKKFDTLLKNASIFSRECSPLRA